MAFQNEGYKNVQTITAIEDVVDATPLKNYLTKFSSHLETRIIWFRDESILADIQKILTY